ncbi:hypothetical protein M413DRAFT_438009 [Hebeloma cylindrosporum]|uniref:Uncharacterized protein n=1 Tax=Hebeloma cylindrosporum TaxID=76867 RepID=A0A0C2YGJ3_HEBCY|nr:hypothetical protein M413DRAFT_438009 [Hebeloma cylindrosporum h7]
MGSAPESLPVIPQDVHAPIETSKAASGHPNPSNWSYPPFPYPSLPATPPTPQITTPPDPTTSSAPNSYFAQASAQLISSMNARWTQSEVLARKRVADSYLERQPIKKPRKPRTCGKCGQASCPGKQMVSRCTNPCRDCGKVECRGRNTKFPTRPCFARDD